MYTESGFATRLIAAINATLLQRCVFMGSGRHSSSENGQDQQQQTELESKHFRRPDSANNIVTARTGVANVKKESRPRPMRKTSSKGKRGFV